MFGHGIFQGYKQMSFYHINCKNSGDKLMSIILLLFNSKHNDLTDFEEVNRKVFICAGRRVFSL